MPEYEVRLMLTVNAEDPSAAVRDFIEHIALEGLGNFIYSVTDVVNDVQTYVQGDGQVFTEHELMAAIQEVAEEALGEAAGLVAARDLIVASFDPEVVEDGSDEQNDLLTEASRLLDESMPKPPGASDDN